MVKDKEVSEKIIEGKNYEINVQYDKLLKIEELKTIPNNWVLWALRENKGKLTKPPINPKTLNLAMSNNSSTWADFLTAKERQESSKGKTYSNMIVGGIGLMLPGTNLIFGDIDNCIDEDGRLTDTAEEMIKLVKEI